MHAAAFVDMKQERTASPTGRTLCCVVLEKEQIIDEDNTVGFEYDYLNLIISLIGLYFSLSFKLR